MPKIKVPQTLDNIEKFEEYRRFAALLFSQITDLINGNLDILDNLRVNRISCQFDSTDTSTQFSHNLGKVPSYYIPISKTAAMNIYNGDSSNTSGLIYLKSDTIGTANIIIF